MSDEQAQALRGELPPEGPRAEPVRTFAAAPATSRCERTSAPSRQTRLPHDANFATRLPVTLNSALRHARNRQAHTLETGTRSRWKAAADHAPIRHVLDWFHFAMRIQHVAQCVKGWPDATADERQRGADLADIVEHIRWRLWHGQARRALDLIGETLLPLDAMAELNSTTTKAPCKMVQALVALETHVAGLSDLIIDYATARRCEEAFSTSPTEGAVQWLLHRRMASQQQMRWSPRDAHLMLKRSAPVFPTAPSTETMPPPSVGPGDRSGKPHDHPQVLDGLS